MIYNRLQIVMLKVIGRKISTGHQNLSSAFPIRTANELCMESSQRVDNPVVYFVLDDGLMFAWEFGLSTSLDVGDFFSIVTFNTYIKSFDVCCSEVLEDDLTNVSHSLGVKEGGGQEDFTVRVREPAREQGFPEFVDVGRTLLNYRCAQEGQLFIQYISTPLY